LIVTYLNQNIAAKLMESVLAAFRSETADLERLAEEVDAAGDVQKIRRAIEQYAKRRTQAMETIHSMLQADAAEFREALAKR
jgi:NAD(P)H-nitrite reductase large subunit